jgi:hypothetical protein
MNWKRLSVSKQTIRKPQMERFNLTKINKVESRGVQNQVKTPNWFATLDSLDDNLDNNMAHKIINMTINISVKGV